MQKLGRKENVDLKFQLKVLHEHREEDFDEFVQRFDNTRPDLDDVGDCFDVLRNSLSDTSAEPFFLSILQHLLFVRDDPNTKSVTTEYSSDNYQSHTFLNLNQRVAYYKLIEECIAQIVLHKNGCDPDFSTKRFSIDVEPLIDVLSGKSSNCKPTQTIFFFNCTSLTC